MRTGLVQPPAVRCDDASPSIRHEEDDHDNYSRSRPGRGRRGARHRRPAAADSGMGDKVDVRSLAAQRPGEAMWLLVTEIDGPAGAVFTASIVPGPQPRAFGGDVLLHLAPGTGPQAHAAISVAVWTVAAGVLVPVAAWDLPDDGGGRNVSAPRWSSP